MLKKQKPESTQPTPTTREPKTVTLADLEKIVGGGSYEDNWGKVKTN